MFKVSHLNNNPGLEMDFIVTIYNFVKQTTNNRLQNLHESLGGSEGHWFPIVLG